MSELPAKETLACSIDDPDADHEWEASEYDPSVGMMSNGRACVICGRFEFVDYEHDIHDDIY